ncbi:MAG: serine/threonine protein kinase [Myxococcales bacterium]|nr:serine/threonine protein kinase [Myxococcales bacterium]
MEIHPGDIVAGKYRVRGVLGRSRGLLLDAAHTEFDQRVAIRVISPQLSDEKEVERFRREARTLAKLESEHVARIIDVGTHTDGSFFLVRQFLDGIDLGQHLRQRGPLRLDEAVLYLLQAAEAVQETHSHNIILRELSPQQLFLTTRRGGSPLVKIIEFGTAKLLRDPGSLPVSAGEASATTMFGMSPYSSPELVRHARVIDRRTDVWSLGAIFYELLTATPPFRGDLAELMMAITRASPRPLAEVRPDLPPELGQILAWALAKDLEGRFESVYAFAHALRPYAPPEGQVLIDRIGQLAQTPARVDASAAPAFSPTSPLSKQSARGGVVTEPTYDSSQGIGRPPAPGAQGVGAEAPAESPMERTKVLGELGFDAMAPGPLPAAAPLAPPGTPPPAPAPAFAPAAPSSMAPSLPGGRLAALGELRGDPDFSLRGGPAPAGATGAYAAQERSDATARQRKLTMAVLGVALVVLPVVILILVFALGSPSDDKAASSASATASAAPPPPATTTTTPAATTSTATASVSGTTISVEVTGGTCALTVDGKNAGSASKVIVKIGPGKHTVVCTPPGGLPKKQEVTVKTGESVPVKFAL